MRVISYIHCAECNRKIREFNDDVVLTRCDGTERRFYHMECLRAAERVVLKEGRDVWRLVHRPAFGEEDDFHGDAA